MSESIISIAAGTIPAAITAETTSPAASVVVNAASSVSTRCGRGSTWTTISVAMPSVPSEPTNAPSRSSSPALSSRTTSPSARTTSSSRTWFVVNPYLRQWAPPEFSATLPPIVHTCWLEGSGA